MEKDMLEQFVPNFKRPELIQILLFEITSWVGRTFLKKRTKIIPKGKLQESSLLDLGVGDNYNNDWINADFFKVPELKRLKFWKKYPSRPKPDLILDLRYPIKCPDSCVDGIYCGHTLEHLYPYDAINLLREIFRILKPYCWLRINVPDIEKYVNFYINKNKNRTPEFSQFKTGCEAISVVTQNYGHHSAWDKVLLTKALKYVGFINIKKVKFGKEGADKRLIKEDEVRRWETLVIEAQKPK